VQKQENPGDDGRQYRIVAVEEMPSATIDTARSKSMDILMPVNDSSIGASHHGVIDLRQSTWP
jgi:hypothetical protein